MRERRRDNEGDIRRRKRGREKGSKEEGGKDTLGRDREI